MRSPPATERPSQGSTRSSGSRTTEVQRWKSTGRTRLRKATRTHAQRRIRSVRGWRARTRSHRHQRLAVLRKVVMRPARFRQRNVALAIIDANTDPMVGELLRHRVLWKLHANPRFLAMHGCKCGYGRTFCVQYAASKVVLPTSSSPITRSSITVGSSASMSSVSIERKADKSSRFSGAGNCCTAVCWSR